MLKKNKYFKSAELPSRVRDENSLETILGKGPKWTTSHVDTGSPGDNAFFVAGHDIL